MSDRSEKIVDFFTEAQKRGKKTLSRDSSITQTTVGNRNRQDVNINHPDVKVKKHRLVSQTAKGDGNMQQVIITETPPIIRYLPPIDSIGSDMFLKQRIQELFNMIGEAREKRYGKMAYPVMYRKFKSDFKIKKQSWTIIWNWPKACAPYIINYLEEKYVKTIPGRAKAASEKEGYVPSRGQLYGREKELLEHFDLKSDSPQVKSLLYEYFGVESHRDLSHLQQWQWVMYLENEVRKLEQ